MIGMPATLLIAAHVSERGYTGRADVNAARKAAHLRVRLRHLKADRPGYRAALLITRRTAAHTAFATDGVRVFRRGTGDANGALQTIAAQVLAFDKGIIQTLVGRIRAAIPVPPLALTTRVPGWTPPTQFVIAAPSVLWYAKIRTALLVVALAALQLNTTRTRRNDTATSFAATPSPTHADRVSAAALQVAAIRTVPIVGAVYLCRDRQTANEERQECDRRQQRPNGTRRFAEADHDTILRTKHAIQLRRRINALG